MCVEKYGIEFHIFQLCIINYDVMIVYCSGEIIELRQGSTWGKSNKHT